MPSEVFCQKKKVMCPGFDAPPYPGPLGIRIQAGISIEAWQEWIARQIILFNEYRLNPLDPETLPFLEKEMETFFFTEESKDVPGHTPTNVSQQKT
jgi:Fe-S cluster biosynthesis and repair protein YggX